MGGIFNAVKTRCIWFRLATGIELKRTYPELDRGRMCSHTTAKCANCGGPHGARADACQAKKIAQHATRGWRSPPPPRREKRVAPGVEARGVEEGGPEVEIEEVEGEGHGAM